MAVLGGLLPPAALLFRERLRDAEVVAFSALLAFTPVLVYYSRFMRKDLRLAAFGFLTVGFAVRALDTRRPRYGYAAAAALGLVFTTKENALLYLVTWLGAGLVTVDRLALAGGDRPTARIVALARRGRRGLAAWGGHLVGAALTTLTVVVFFYAPQTAGDGPGLWAALSGRPAQLPAVVSAATVGSARKAVDY